MDQRESTFKKFLEKWPVDKVKSLVLVDYAMGNSNYKETFSYWVEGVTDNLGDVGGIGGGGSFKHGIYYMTRKKQFVGNKKDDGQYAWWVKYGNTADEAFQKIKNLLLKVIELAKQGNLEEIDKIDFYTPVKWKWAFMYSNSLLFPVYKKEALEIAARQLGYTGTDYNYPSLYQFLNSQKSITENVFAFGERVWEIYIKNKPCNYYILGSKYGPKADVDVFPEMLERNVICNGFANEYDLENFVGKPQNEIVQYLSQKGEESKSYSCLKYFLNIKPGDKIAVKADGSPKGDEGFLSIVGIAEAVDADDYYGYEPDDLGHVIKVKWLKAPVYKEFKRGGYGRTLHKLSDKVLINEIFNSEYEIIPTTAKGNTKMKTIQQHPLNSIYYGPPGTGKTHQLSDVIREWKLTEKPARTELNFDEFAEDYNWWQIIAMVLSQVKGSIKVPDLRNNPLIQAKYRNSTLKDLDARLWSTLQHNSSDECPNVGLKKKLGGVRIFFKEKDSSWHLDSIPDFKETFSDLNAAYESFNIPSVDSKEIKHYTFTTCHQSLAYEDFIEGIKPNLATEDNVEELNTLFYKNRKGLFYIACDKAARRAGYRNLIECLDATVEHRKMRFDAAIKDNKIHVLFLDEINRCNIAAVFGELITLIEDNKRLGADNEIADTFLPYSQKYFGVPSNLYIIGTMNTADRSVEALDTALRRRFSFEFMPPDENKVDEKFNGTDIPLRNIFVEMNKRIAYLLNEDHQIGHSYFMKLKDEAELKDAFKNKIIPLLKEYFYNDYGKIRMVLGDGFVERIDESKSSPGFAVKGNDADTDFGKVVYKIYSEGRPNFAEALLKIIPA